MNAFSMDNIEMPKNFGLSISNEDLPVPNFPTHCLMGSALGSTVDTTACSTEPCGTQASEVIKMGTDTLEYTQLDSQSTSSTSRRLSTAAMGGVLRQVTSTGSWPLEARATTTGVDDSQDPKSPSRHPRESPTNPMDPEVSERLQIVGTNQGEMRQFGKDGDEDEVTSSSDRRSQMEITLSWLDDNYERADGVCLPRCVLYTHYLDLCKKRRFTPAGAATFGKIIRQRFPKLTTRRLGTRGQSKYHYYGIGIKESSIYYHSVYTGKGLTRFSGTKVKTEGSSRKYSLSSKTGTLLPEFPKTSDLILDPNTDPEKVETFLVMYRTHCQRILDTVISATFEEVQNFLLHFWQGMPEHLIELLDLPIITELAGFCDSILYKVLIDVLVPNTIQDLPDSLSVEIKGFARRLPIWLKNSLEDVAESLKRKKLEVARQFSQVIRRQISFIHLAQTSRGVLQCSETVDGLLNDLKEIECDRLCSQVACIHPSKSKQVANVIKQNFEEFCSLTKKQMPIESYTEWIDNLIDSHVLQKCGSNPGLLQGQTGRLKLQDLAASFLLQWSVFSSFLMRDLTLNNAKRFGSFHLLYMTFNEYVLLVMETQQTTIRESEQKRQIFKFLKSSGEFSLQTKVRSLPGKGPVSPKPKRRKVGERQQDKHTVDRQEDNIRETERSSPADSQGDFIPSPLSQAAHSAHGPDNDPPSCLSMRKPTSPKGHLTGTVPSEEGVGLRMERPTHILPVPVSPIKPTPTMRSLGGAGISNVGTAAERGSPYLPGVQVGYAGSYLADYLSPGGGVGAAVGAVVGNTTRSHPYPVPSAPHIPAGSPLDSQLTRLQQHVDPHLPQTHHSANDNFPSALPFPGAMGTAAACFNMAPTTTAVGGTLCGGGGGGGGGGGSGGGAGGGGGTGTYWSEVCRGQQGGLVEGYPTSLMAYSKYGEQCDGYGRPTGGLLRSGGFQDSFTSCRSAFEPSRAFYSRPGDNMLPVHTSTGAMALPPYGTNMNYMDVTPPGGQCRPEGFLGNHQHQDVAGDLYSTPFTSPMASLNKPFMPTFR